MRALTIRQPWASCIALHGKNIENRTWSTTYRGPLVIHAGKGVDHLNDAAWAWSHWDPTTYMATRWPRRGAPVATDPLPLGAVVAVAELADVLDPDEPCDSPWAQEGQHHWVLSNVRPLRDPIPVKGRLGLWTPTPDLIDLVTEEVG